MFIPEGPGEGPLGPLLSEDLVLLGREEGAPFGVVTSVKVVYERRFIRRVSDYPAAASTGITSSVNSSPRRTRRALVSDSALM